jgi:predicted O-methyltransferase YrrM
MQARRLRQPIRFALDRLPYVGRLREELRRSGAYPSGHFYSPIPTKAEIGARLETRPPAQDPCLGIALNRDQQFKLLQMFERFYADLPFSEEHRADCRYYFRQSTFCYADAIFLYSFLRHTQPKRIIEVGSGYSSAVMLDTVDRFFETAPQITLVEPYPDTVRKLFRPEDYRRVSLIEDVVQRVPVETFTTLETGDLLFIDSSHVVKCGSDVQYLLFDVLPHLAPGVYVHFHDVFQAFEYPAEWLRDGWYWNEDYLLRAFLSFNSAWEIVLFGNDAVHTFEPWLAEHLPLCVKNPGGSLYLRRTA